MGASPADVSRMELFQVPKVLGPTRTPRLADPATNAGSSPGLVDVTELSLNKCRRAMSHRVLHGRHGHSLRSSRSRPHRGVLPSRIRSGVLRAQALGEDGTPHQGVASAVVLLSGSPSERGTLNGEPDPPEDEAAKKHGDEGDCESGHHDTLPRHALREASLRWSL